MALDYQEAFAAQRNLAPSRLAQQNIDQFPPSGAGSATSSIRHADLHIVRVVERYIAIVIDMRRARRQGSGLTNLLTRNFEKVAEQVSGLWPGAERDLATISQNSRLVGWVVRGRADLAVRALLAARDDRRDLTSQRGLQAKERSR
jgi:hypothetical protein